MAAFDPVVAIAAPDAVVAAAADDPVITGSAVYGRVIGAVELEIVRFDFRRFGIVAHHHLQAQRGENGVLLHRVRSDLLARIHVEHVIGHGEGIDMRAVVDNVVGRAANAVRSGHRLIGVGLHQLRERVFLQLVQQVETLRAGQVVEPVVVLQVFHLRFEHGVEGRAEEAAECHRAFRQATDPHVDRVDPGFGSRTVEEGKAIGCLFRRFVE